MSDGALSVAVAALQSIAQLGSQERDRVTAQAALDSIEALAKEPCLFPLPDGRRCLECETCQALPSAVREQEA